MNGGIGSFALIWLPIVAFEAAFSGSRRVVVASLGVAALVVILLLALEASGLFRTPSPATPSSLPELSALLAVFYAAGLALRWDTVQKKLAETRQSKEARYQLLAENMTDLVTRHAPNGAVSLRVARIRTAVGRGCRRASGPRPVRARARRRPARISDRSFGCEPGRRMLRRIPRPARSNRM